ncbi:MAG: ABC transporter substrate-binding protein [Hyphomicrobiaceae bacterium]
MTFQITRRAFSTGAATALLGAVTPAFAADRKAGELIPIRVGYVPNWNVQSNFVAVLRFTDAMNQVGLKPVFTPFLAGGPLNQAMLGGQLDIGLIGGGPAVSLVANGFKAKIIARISDVRDALIVKTDSPFKTVGDLKGKTIASFVGSNTYMVLLSLLKGGGLDPKKDVNIVNLSPDAHYNALMNGDIGAYDTWDPYIELAQERGGVRILAQGKTAGPGVAVVSDDFLAKNRDATVRMLEAIAIGIWYMAKNKDQVNTWLAEDTKMSKAVITRSSEVDRNYRTAPDLLDVGMEVSDEDVKGLNEIVGYFGSLNQIKTRPEMAKFVDRAPLKEAVARLKKNPNRKVTVTKS